MANLEGIALLLNLYTFKSPTSF